MTTKSLSDLMRELETLRQNMRPEGYQQFKEQFGKLMLEVVPECIEEWLVQANQRIADLKALAERSPRVRDKAVSAIQMLEEANLQLGTVNAATSLPELANTVMMHLSAQSAAASVFAISELLSKVN
ncbi:hypothetical protein LZC95_20150 [Pendulispora brunnea]|uniref:DUF1641 domain-containing protein n=1 Tax=Pendulispora brunnea TaxID=2905690 RepID=A0ABZ2KKB5_9BACT